MLKIVPIPQSLSINKINKKIDIVCQKKSKPEEILSAFEERQ